MSFPIKPPPKIPDLLGAYHAPAAAPPTRSASGAPARQFAAPISIYVGELTGYSTMSEGASGGAHRATFTTRFITRYRADFAPHGRIELAGRFYEITGIAPAPHVARHTYQILHCQQALQ